MTNDELRLRDMPSAVEDAAAVIARGRAAFDADPLLQRAAKNVVAEIGEAAKLLSEATTSAIADVNWTAARRMRDLTVHRYWAVMSDILWTTLSDDLPPRRVDPLPTRSR